MATEVNLHRITFPQGVADKGEGRTLIQGMDIYLTTFILGEADNGVDRTLHQVMEIHPKTLDLEMPLDNGNTAPQHQRWCRAIRKWVSLLLESPLTKRIPEPDTKACCKSRFVYIVEQSIVVLTTCFAP